MKYPIFHKLKLPLLALSAFLLAQGTYAQNSEKNKNTRIRISVTDPENNQEVVKEYKENAMSDAQRKRFVDKVLDSLGLDKSKKGQIVSVTIEDGDKDGQIITRKRKTVVGDSKDEDAFAWNYDGNKDLNFNFNSEKLRDQMRNFERDFKPKAQIWMRDMEDFGNKMGNRMGDWMGGESNKAASVRDLNVYANNPDNGVLNLRFQVPQKGNLTITVTDVKGKEVGSKEVKDFSGNFVGQIDLKKNTKGTLFVTVVQNEDGAVKRVVIP